MIKTERRAVTLYPSDWQIIEEADTASAGVSATLRRIVREWHERRQGTLVDPGTHTEQSALPLVDSSVPYVTESSPERNG